MVILCYRIGIDLRKPGGCDHHPDRVRWRWSTDSWARSGTLASTRALAWPWPVNCWAAHSPATAPGTWHLATDGLRAIINSLLTVLIDPARLGTQDVFASESRAVIHWLHLSPLGAGVDNVQIAGEIERTARAARTRDGIKVDASTWQEIAAAGRKVGFELA